jgi:outer membrane protein assembly factor BamB
MGERKNSPLIFLSFIGLFKVVRNQHGILQAWEFIRMKQERDSCRGPLGHFSRVITLLLLLTACQSVTAFADWPTYNHDNARSGVTSEKLTMPLNKHWEFKALHAPSPVWPPPAKADYFHKVFNMKPRVVYDRAFHVVAAGNSVYWGSSSASAVYCLDQQTGKISWRFCADGPVRLAPTVAGDKLLFGSDDGYVYCLNRKTGALLWKTLPGEESTYLPANGRISSSRPIRSGILVIGNKGYYCAGIIPSQGMYHGVVEIDSGNVVEEKRIENPAQGYLHVTQGRLFSSNGRLKPGQVRKLEKQEPDRPGKPLAVNNEFPHCVIANSENVFRGGDGKVMASDTSGKEVWRVDVDGKAYSMAIADGNLLVSTDTGRIYCFGPTGKSPSVVEEKAEEVVPTEAVTRLTNHIVDGAAHKKGYCLVLGGESFGLIVELARQSDFQIVVRDPDSAICARLRNTLAARGMYGRISVHEGGFGELPYVDYIFNLVVHDGLVTNKKYAGNVEEVKRILCPGKGVAILDAGPEATFSRPHLKGAGEWSHFYGDPGNTACSSDRFTTANLELQWIGEPGPRNIVDRHNKPPAPLYKNGRIFVSGTDWYAGVDAYNGTVLWQMDVPGSMRPAALKNCSNMAATDTHLMAIDSAKCLKIKAESGKVEREFSLIEKDSEWGYVAAVDGLLFGSSTVTGVSRFDLAPSSWGPGYSQNQPVVCSRSVFAVDLKTGGRLWTYAPETGRILNPTIAIGRKTVFFIESVEPDPEKRKTGKAALGVLFERSPKLVALDYTTGRAKWSSECELKLAHAIYLACIDNKLIISGSRVSPTDRKIKQDGRANDREKNKDNKQITYDLICYDADSGVRAWESEYVSGGDRSGSHGELTQHPVIVDDAVYLWNAGFALGDGKRLEEWKWDRKGHGCGTLSASASHLFWRGKNPMMGDIKAGTAARINTVSRPGCWINIIPAGGLVLIPEGSSGCKCDYAVQSSFAYRPVE